MAQQSGAAVAPSPAATTPTPPALDLQQVSHHFGDLRAVADVDLTIAPGQVLCLVGPSGCGKTTLLRLVAGLEPLQQGRVLVNGHAVADEAGGDPPEQRNIGLVFQDYALFPHLNVTANVAFGLRDASRGDRARRAAAALDQVGMAEYADAYPDQLSGGQQQRVALARALLPRPKLMLLDEPFSGLDARLRDRIRDQTLHILKDSGAASLLVTHDPEEAMFMADCIAVMRDGAIQQVGPPEELYFRPVNRFVAGFFSEVNAFQASIVDGHAATPFGPISAPSGLAGAAEVLIRPEAIVLDDHGGDPDRTCTATVEAARFLGRTSLLHLTVPRAEGDLHLHARVPGCVLPQPGNTVTLRLNPSLAFVFAATGAK